MNFDATHIAIRERGYVELLDLAVQVCRVHAGPLFVALFVGATPMMLVNWLLLNAMLEEGLWNNPAGYLYWLTVLMMLQAPLATAFITLYLGQVTFATDAGAGRVASDFFRCLPQMLFYQGFVRALCWPLHLTMLLPYVRWPFISELILLERNPYFAGKAKRLTTSRRSKNLHRGAEGEVFGRAVLSLLVGGLLILSVVGGVLGVGVSLLNAKIDWQEILLYLLPAAGWLVIGFFAVARFLSYLDLRIRREGWEVELQMRAEALRLSAGGAA